MLRASRHSTRRRCSARCAAPAGSSSCTRRRTPAGFGAEIAARAAERALDCLLAPIERVTGFDTVMPLPKLERDYLPGVERIVAALRRTLESD